MSALPPKADITSGITVCPLCAKSGHMHCNTRRAASSSIWSFEPFPSSVGGTRVQSDDHHVQANLPTANTTTHTIRNKNIETDRLACFLNSLRHSFNRVVRWKNTDHTKKKIGIRTDG